MGSVLHILLVLALLLHCAAPVMYDPSQQTRTFTDYSGEISFDSSIAIQTPYSFTIDPSSSISLPVTSAQSPVAGEAACSSISFVFQEMQIRAAEVRFFEFNSRAIFYQCTSCLQDYTLTSPQLSYMPPLFNSSTGKVQIVVCCFDRSALEAQTFTIQWTCNTMYTDTTNSVLSSQLALALDLSTGYGTVRPLLSTHFESAGTLVPKLYPATTQTFTIRNPAKYRFKAGKNGVAGVWESVSSASGVIRMAVTLVKWPVSLCGSVTLRIYAGNNKIYDACNSGSVNNEIKWLSSNNDGIALVQLINSNPTTTSGSELYFEVDWYADSDLWECGEKNQPDRVIADSWMLTDGSQGYFQPNGGGEQRKKITQNTKATCEWLLSPLSAASGAATVTLLFHWVSLKPGSRVVVYDSSYANGTALWDSGFTARTAADKNGVCYTTPPPITSTGSSLYVVFLTDVRSDSSIHYYGFAGAYLSNSVSSMGLGNSLSSLTMSSALDISPPGNGSVYLPGLTYTWIIQPRIVINDALVSGGPITFAVGALNLPSGDSLTLYDGSFGASPPNSPTVLAVLTGSTTPRQFFTTRSAVASMVFHSAQSSTGKGVAQVSYTSDGPNFHCGFTRNPAVLRSASMVITDGSYSKEPLYSRQLCQWSIAPVGALGIFLTFNRFSLFGGTVKIYDGPVSAGQLIATISETAAVPAPLLFYSSSAVMGIEYQSGSVVSGTGFNATYFGIVPSQTSLPGDGVIRIFSSSMQALQHMSYRNLLYANSSIVYVVQPASSFVNHSAGSLFFSIASLNLTGNCNDAMLEVYDGDRTLLPRNLSFYNSSYAGSALMARLCGSDIPDKWIKTGPSGVATLRLSTNERHSDNTTAAFSMSYFSDAPSSHCGFPANPGLLTAPSMVFTDGSASYEQLYTDQDCEMVIAPPQAQAAGAGGGGLIVLEILACDLRGAKLSIYEGGDPNGKDTALLWQCEHCSIAPRPLISRSSSIFVRYSSDSLVPGTARGAGFKAVYWTLNTSSLSLSQTAPSVLELPLGMRMATDSTNATTSWRLGLGTATKAQLSVFPRYTLQDAAKDFGAQNVTRRALDGRPRNSSLDSLSGSAAICGFVSASLTSSAGVASSVSPLPNTLHTLNSSLVMATNQRADYYLASSTTGDKSLFAAQGSLDTSLPASPVVDDNAASMFHAADTCKYTIDSGNLQSVSLSIDSWEAGGSRLRVLGGVYGWDQVLFDSRAPGAFARSFTAWCGKVTMILEPESDSGTAASAPTHSLMFSYEINTKDSGLDCLNYKLSLLPKVIKPDPLIPLYIALGALGACCLGFVGFYHLRRYLRRHWPEGGLAALFCRRIKTYQVVTPRHLRYTPRLDELRNRLLRPGKCCVCQDDKLPVFTLTGCGHALCKEDLLGYLNSALGDISMFPVKCPMHYEGCAGSIDAKLAKRVLTQVGFDKFNEFSDRATYGEGMRCIFCVNFVNFPLEGAISMVECPYCIQRFCMRCKKSWHFGSRCPLDKVDDTLDEWRKASAAQRCPCCHKLIEKDDPNTCNHMVHKVTDGIPCLRDRTDFCYLCGEEVTPDYPHEEVRNLGINHFPDGVFQTCRKVALREREAERERLKRARRMKGKRPADRGVQSFGFGVLGTDENNPQYEEHNWSDDEVGGKDGDEAMHMYDDAFDVQWGMALGPGGADTLRGAPGHRSSSPTRTGGGSVALSGPGGGSRATVGGGNISPPAGRRHSTNTPGSRPTSNQGSRTTPGSRNPRISPNG